MIGNFIVAEGITGTGKTTQMKMLVERLKSKGINAFFNHEPTDHTPFGRLFRCMIEGGTCSSEDIRMAERLSHAIALQPLGPIVAKIKVGELLTEFERQMLCIADRHEDLRGTIAFNLLRGYWCAQDRYSPSTFAFAETDPNVSYTELRRIHDEMLRVVYMIPDILLYLDVDPETGLERSKASGKPIDIYETLSKIKKTRAAYKKLLEDTSLYHELHVIDARPPINEVFRAICLKLGI